MIIHAFAPLGWNAYRYVVSMRADQAAAGAPLITVVGYGVLVGAVGGLGAWLFRLMIAFVHNLLFLGRLDFNYDANLHTAASPWGPWVILVPVVGAVVVVFLVRRFAPEARGHGVPEVMDAIYYQSGIIRPIVAAIKAIASAVSIGSGGSVGREGPIVQIGASFGSALGQLRRLGLADRRLLIAAGSAAGIAATFNAPLGGVLFAIELLLVVVTPRTLLVVGVAVASGIGVARLLLGSQLAFTILSLERVAPVMLGWVDVAGLITLGVVIGLVSVSLNRGLYWTEDRFDHRFRNPYLAHITGMGIVGVTMFVFFVWLGQYSVEGVGYATITDVLQGALTSPWVLLALAGGKWLATVLTLGSGASGGVFSPSLFLGATVGGALGHVLLGAGAAVDPVILALAGMAATVAGATGAVLTAIVMVTEMTGDFGVAVPLLLAAITATSVRSKLSPSTIYTEKLLRRGHWVPVGLQAAGVVDLRAGDLVGTADGSAPPESLPEPARVSHDSSLFEVLGALGDHPVIAVVDQGRVIGSIRRDDAAAAVEPMGTGRLEWPARTSPET